VAAPETGNVPNFLPRSWKKKKLAQQLGQLIFKSWLNELYRVDSALKKELTQLLAQELSQPL
jgi:hypothetical protein